MKKSLFSILFFCTVVVYCQTGGDTNVVASTRPICVKEWDDNLFYCNWNTTQSYAYFVPSPDTTGGIGVELLKGDEKFALPRYGTLWSVFKKEHKGLDIDLKTGDSVISMFDGIVRYAQFNTGGFGNLVIVRHYNGLETYYGHLSKLKVKVNQKVKSGELLGLGGSTGRSYNPHLHLEVRYQDHPLDPFIFIDWVNKKLSTNLAVLDKKAFSPWDMGIKPADISKPNYTTVANPNVVVDTNATNVQEINPNASYYYVKKGDTLYSIAKANGTTLNQICDWNGIKDPDRIMLGQKIRVK